MGYRPATSLDRHRLGRGLFADAASLYLGRGDVIECEIERIGVLRNPVISWQEGHGGPPRRARVRW